MGNNKITIRKGFDSIIQDFAEMVPEAHANLFKIALTNFVKLIEKGYDLDDNLEEIYNKYKNIDDVPDKIHVTDKETF